MSNGWVPLSTTPFRAPSSSAPAVPAPTPPASSEIRVNAVDGHVQGIDGMLDQVARAVMRYAGPALRQDVLPVLQEDTRMQTRIGQAVGAEIADRWRPWIIVGAGALSVLALVELARFARERASSSPGAR